MGLAPAEVTESQFVTWENGP